MTLQKAIKILRLHNQWRRGAEIEPQSPKEIGEAIDRVLKELDKPTSRAKKLR